MDEVLREGESIGNDAPINTINGNGDRGNHSISMGSLRESREVYQTEPTNDMVGSNQSEPRGISINPLNSGYMVKVGCQSVAVETTEKLIDMLNKYLTDPSEFERKWYSKNNRNRLENI